MDIATQYWTESDDKNTHTQPNGFPGNMPAYIDQSGRMIMGAVKRSWRRSNPYYATTGVGDDYVVVPEFSGSNLNLYEILSLRMDRSNTTTTPTLNFGNTGPLTIVKMTDAGKTALAVGDLIVGVAYSFYYDGTNYILGNPSTIGGVQPGDLAVIYPTKADAEAATIPASEHALRIDGDLTVGDGLGGLYIDVDNGNPDTFTSSGGTTRTWYRAPDVSGSRLDATITAALALADTSLQPTDIGNTVAGLGANGLVTPAQLPLKDQILTVNGFSSVLSSNTADRAANQALLVALLALTPTGPIHIDFGTGGFPIQNIPKLSNRNVSITGKGWGQTWVEFSNTASPDIEIEQNSLVYDSEVTGCMFLRSGSTTFSCVSVTRPVALSGAEYRGPNISDNMFHGKDGNTWAVHINLVEGWLYLVQRNQFKGSDTTLVSQAVRLTGASTAGTITDNQGINLQYGVYSPPGSFSEGAYIMNNRFVGVTFGVYMEDGSNAPGGHIIGNHIASLDNAITIIARPQWQIAHNLIYRDSTAPAGWIGIFFSAACADSCIQENRIISPVANSVSTDTGIFTVSTTVDVVNNRIRNIYTPINLNDTNTGIVDRNSYTGHTGTAILGTAVAVLGTNSSIA